MAERRETEEGNHWGKLLNEEEQKRETKRERLTVEGRKREMMGGWRKEYVMKRTLAEEGMAVLLEGTHTAENKSPSACRRLLRVEMGTSIDLARGICQIMAECVSWLSLELIINTKIEPRLRRMTSGSHHLPWLACVSSSIAILVFLIQLHILEHHAEVQADLSCLLHCRRRRQTNENTHRSCSRRLIGGA